MGKPGNPAKAKAARKPRWTPFQRYDDLPTGEQVWQNSRFMVIVALTGVPGLGWSGIEGDHDAHLSWRLADRAAEVSWRDVQRMKSELCGSEAEALEVYPAEGRVLDGSNQRHLFVWRPGNPAAPRLGFYNGRQVADAAQIAEQLDGIPLVLAGGRAMTSRQVRARGVQAPFEDGVDAHLGHDGLVWEALR